MYAIVDIAGQQFKVEKGQQIYVHRLDSDEGNKLDFEKVLLIDDEGKITIGEPVINGAYIEAKVLQHKKGDKVVVFKKKRRKGYKVKNGHRQSFSHIEILSINAKGFVKKAAKVAAPKATEKKVAEKKAAAPKAAEKKVAEKKAVAPKASVKSTEDKPKKTARTSAASKQAGEKKAAVKKEKPEAATAKKAPAKTTAAKKTTATKASAKKDEVKKTAAKKPAAKKTTTAKPKTTAKPAAKAAGSKDKKAE